MLAILNNICANGEEMVYSQLEQQGLYDSANEHDACGIGFVANIKGHQSHEIVQRGLQVLERMAHRGAEGADNETGDGAGILLQIPGLFQRWLPNLPKTGQYGTGLVFFPTKTEEIEYCKNIIHSVVVAEGFRLITWREVPRYSSVVGKIAQATEPEA